jgi:hypothetical protein
VATPAQTSSLYHGLRVVAGDGTTLTVPDEEALTWHFPKHVGEVMEFGHPLLRLVALVECGARESLVCRCAADSLLLRSQKLARLAATHDAMIFSW